MSINWATSNVLVTGGNGFLGHHMIDALKNAGATNIFIARSKDYDLTKETDVQRLFQDYKPDVVFHLAGLVGGILPNKERPADYFYQNLMMGTMMLHYAQQHNVKKFIAAGAGCGYPIDASIPIKEDSFWTGMPQLESAPYSLAKRLLTIQSEAYYRQFGFVSIIGVPGNLYGPWDNFHLLDSHVIPGLVRKFVDATENGDDQVEVWGSGKPTRDFVYAADVADGLLKAAETYDKNEIVNISSGVETSVIDIVKHLKELSGFSKEVVWNTDRPEGQARRCFDISKAQKELHFAPKYDIRKGLEKTVKWYQKNRNNPDLRL